MRRKAASASPARQPNNKAQEHSFQLKLTVVGGTFGIIAALGGALAGAWAAGVFDSQSQPAASPAASPTGPLAHGDASAFIRDVTYPDYSKVYTGARFTKIWELRDTGIVRWTGRYLAALGPSSGGCKYPARVTVPTTNPGGTVDISVSVTAPASPGLCYVTWRMVTPTGELYFPNATQGIWFKVTAISPKASS
jgi:hypothetical protein